MSSDDEIMLSVAPLIDKVWERLDYIKGEQSLLDDIGQNTMKIVLDALINSI